jgi:hypothetical protein
MNDHDKLKCLCKIMRCLCDGEDCCPSPAHGESRLDVGAASTVIDLSNDGTPVQLPPGGEFSTNASGLERDFEQPGAATLRYTGERCAVAKIDATVSLEREPASTDQHLDLFLNVGAPPTLATLLTANRQRFNLLADREDVSIHVQATVELQPQDVIQVWIAKELADPTDESAFTVTGFTCTAFKLRDCDQQNGHEAEED